jgi:cobalt/nickel transport protein
MPRNRIVNLLLLVGVVALFAVPLAIGMNTSGQPAGEAYAGTDSKAADAVEQVDPGYKPWFSPLFEPGSSEVESGLFSLQAALGAGAFGFALGRLSGRRGSRTRVEGQGTLPAPASAPRVSRS